MHRYIERMALGKPLGLLGFYAKAHVDLCPACKRALEALKKSLAKLAKQDTDLPEDRESFWSDLEAQARDNPERGP
jgi:glucose-6-phosphate dehydrogenase assembly protein OpcA